MSQEISKGIYNTPILDGHYNTHIPLLYMLSYSLYEYLLPYKSAIPLASLSFVEKKMATTGNASQIQQTK